MPKVRLLVTVDFEVEVEIPRGDDPQELYTDLNQDSFELCNGAGPLPTNLKGWETGAIEILDKPTILAPEVAPGVGKEGGN
jgi:hypothetical protein